MLVLRRAWLQALHQAEIQTVRHVALQSVLDVVQIVQESGLHAVKKADLLATCFTTCCTTGCKT
jgi:hypothetical protein